MLYRDRADCKIEVGMTFFKMYYVVMGQGIEILAHTFWRDCKQVFNYGANVPRVSAFRLLCVTVCSCTPTRLAGENEIEIRSQLKLVTTHETEETVRKMQHIPLKKNPNFSIRQRKSNESFPNLKMQWCPISCELQTYNKPNSAHHHIIHIQELYLTETNTNNYL